MKNFEVWAEGYNVTGDRARALYLGTAYGVATFDDAVRIAIASNPVESSLFVKHPDGHWTYWGCRLFDNEKDARKAFG